jgi:hypothetical protein
LKTIETKPGVTLKFIACPRGYEKTAYTYPEGMDPLRKWEPIGRLSEITEEQAKELVEEKEGFYKNYSEPFCVCVGPDGSLNSVALSLGIKESDFDQYLVIKL